MALERTIKTETKSRLKGILDYADVASAVNRWVVTNSMRNQLVNTLLELVELKHTTDGNKELRKAERRKTNMTQKI